VHKQSFNRSATLPGVSETTFRRQFNRKLQIRVIENDQSFL
jgi:hypothetical protein